MRKLDENKASLIEFDKINNEIMSSNEKLRSFKENASREKIIINEQVSKHEERIGKCE